MKIALINDTHFGARNDNPNYAKYFYKFWDNIFFPYLEEHNIKNVIHLGDVLDRRKFVNFKTLNDFNNKFVKRIKNLNVDIIIGNHDTYYKNTNEINAPQELMDWGDVYAEPKVILKGGMKMLYVPWVTPENIEKTTMMLEQESADIVLGHLEVKGFEMFNGAFADSGLERKLFRRFEKVLSGHFHRKSDNGTIYYLGTQYEITWSDYRCPKGFHIFDTDTRELTRISNPIRMFRKIVYNDKKENYLKKDIQEFNNTHIKVIVEEKTDVNQFNDFLDRLHNDISTYEVNVIEDSYNINATADVNVLDQGEDTKTFLENYINSLDTELDKGKLVAHMREFYNEVQDK